MPDHIYEYCHAYIVERTTLDIHLKKETLQTDGRVLTLLHNTHTWGDQSDNIILHRIWDVIYAILVLQNT